MSRHPRYDPARAFYVGLNKVRDYYTVGRHKIPDSSRTVTATVKGTGSLGPTVADGKLSGSAEATGTLQTLDVKDIGDRSELLAIAPQIFNELLTAAEAVPPYENYETGRTYEYTGPVRFCLRTHDDFRAEGAQERAPRLGLWLIELPDGPDAEVAESVTWIVLSGTAQGQIRNELGGSVSDWRAGSDTMALFELMHAKTVGEEPPRLGTGLLQDPWFALAARNMLRDSAKQTVELAFSCLSVKDCCTAGDEATVSYEGWSPASDGREVPVSRVVIGTPYFVQTAVPVKRGLMRQLREYLGFRQQRWSRKVRL